MSPTVGALSFLQKEDILTIPNLLSGLRILAAPVISYLIITDDFNSAAVLFGAAGVTDLVGLEYSFFINFLLILSNMNCRV